MENIKNILVSLEPEGQSYEIGEMVRDNRTIYFRYNTEFLKCGFNISPIKQPYNNEINSAESENLKKVDVELYLNDKMRI